MSHALRPAHPQPSGDGSTRNRAITPGRMARRKARSMSCVLLVYCVCLMRARRARAAVVIPIPSFAPRCTSGEAAFERLPLNLPAAGIRAPGAPLALEHIACDAAAIKRPIRTDLGSLRRPRGFSHGEGSRSHEPSGRREHNCTDCADHASAQHLSALHLVGLQIHSSTTPSPKAT